MQGERRPFNLALPPGRRGEGIGKSLAVGWLDSVEQLLWFVPCAEF